MTETRKYEMFRPNGSVIALDSAARAGKEIPSVRSTFDYAARSLTAHVEATRDTLDQLDRVPATTPNERLVADLARERLTAQQAVDETEHLRRLSIIGSPLQAIRTVFERMPRSTDDDGGVGVRRLGARPACVDSIRASLGHGIIEGIVAARRQAEACATQALVYGGGLPDSASLGAGLLAAFDARDGGADWLLRGLAAEKVHGLAR